MRKRCNPHQQKGERNLFCDHYSNCLDYVIQNGWPVWDCTWCTYKRNQFDKPIVFHTDTDTFDHHDLSPDFQPIDGL